MKFIEDSTNSMTKLKSAAKAQMIEDLMEFFASKYGAEKAHMMRWGKGEKSKTTEIGVIGGTVVFNNEEFELPFGIDVTVKEYRPHSGPKKDYDAFDIRAAWDEYDAKVEADAIKKAEQEAKKTEKIEKDKAKREAEKKLREQEDELPGMEEF